MTRAAFLCALLLAVGAQAAVAVLPFKGPGGAAARKAVLAALSERPDASAPGADLQLEGTVLKGGRKVQVRVTGGATSSVSQSLLLRLLATGPRSVRLEPASAANLWSALERLEPAPQTPTAPAEPLAPAPAVTSPPAAPALQVLATVTEPPPSRPAQVLVSPSEERTRPPPLPLLDLAVGGGLQRRSLNFRDDIFHAMDSYQLAAGPSLEADVELFPGALATTGLWANLGVMGRYSFAPGLASVDAAGDRLATLSDSWEVGPKLRWPFGRTEAFLSGSYFRQRFSFQVPEGATSAPVIPGFSYVSIRVDGGVRVALADWFWVLADGAYLHVLDSGQVGTASYFPRLAVSGLEGRLGGALRISGPFEVRVWADYRRYFFSMNPEPGDPYIAGGALDEYLAFTAAIAARW